MKPNNIQLHIENLVLHGFAPGDRDRIAAAVQQELTRLMTEQGLSATLTGGNSLERVDGGSFAMAANARAEGIGAQIAQSIYGGMGQ
jgi:hypothetical protein